MTGIWAMAGSDAVHPVVPEPDLAVRTESLAKVYPGGTAAVADLSLGVRRGEVLALLGPNGAGRSTTAGMLTTSVRPTSGRPKSRASMSSQRQRPCTCISGWSRSATRWTAA